MKFDIQTFDVAEYHRLLDRGLSQGVGKRDGQMCIEAAICTVLGLDHGDSASIALETLRELGSPGVQLIGGKDA